MRIELVEYEVTCAEHGPHIVVVPDHCPIPHRCDYCFHELSARKLLRHYFAEGPVKGLARPEAWVG